MNTIKRLLIVGGDAARMDADIRERFRAGREKSRAFIASVGADIGSFRGGFIDGLIFNNPPAGNEWKFSGELSDDNGIKHKIYKPNKRTKKGRELAEQMQHPFLPEMRFETVEFLLDQSSFHQFPGLKRSRSGKAIISIMMKSNGEFPEVIDGLKEISEQEYHSIMAEEPAV